ncbi:MAG: O-antigen ligase family protein [Candidatus Margulisiibacteriota bacterium]
MLKTLENEVRVPAWLFSLYCFAIPFEAFLHLEVLGGTLIRYIGMITICSMAFYMIIKREKICFPNSAKLLLVFFLWAGASVFWSADPEHAFGRFMYEIRYFLMFLAATAFPFSKKEVSLAVKAVIVSGIIASLYIIYTSIMTNQILENYTRSVISSGETMTGPNSVAGMLILPFSLLIGSVLAQKSRLSRLNVIFAFSIFSAVLFTGSRGGLLGLFTAFLSLLVFWGVSRRGAALLSVISGFCYWLFLEVSERVAKLSERFVFSGDLNRFSANRIDIWSKGFETWMNSPLIGYGYANYIVVSGTNMSSHNIYLGALLELGIIGFFLIVSSLASLLLFKPSDETQKSAFSGALGVLVLSATLYTMNFNYFWLALILVEISKKRTA